MSNKTELTAADWGLIIGCECHLFWSKPDGSIEYERTGTLCGIRPEDVRQNGLLFIVKTANSRPQELAYKYSEAKPILRPLSDMTEEEAEWCAKELFCDKNEEPDAFATNRARIAIMDNFGTPLIASWRISFLVSRYLLSKHFDLFGWIPAGLAIDKTKLETP